MKKIFTLALAAALAMPVFAAKVDVKCYKSGAGQMVGNTKFYAPDESAFLGTYANQSISYDAANECYNIEDFIGYNKANFSFKIKEYNPSFDERRFAIEFTTPYGSAKEPALSERTSIAYNIGAPSYKVGFYLNPARELTQSSDGGEDRDNPIYRSGEFTGAGDGFALAQPDLAANGSATNDYYTTRTYAVKDGNKYKIYIRTTVMSSWKKENSEWVYDDDTYYRSSVYLCFEITDKLEGMGGGETPEGTAVTIETWDDYKTTKVAEDFTGSLAYNNGEYTLSGIYGAADVDFRFKVGAYNEYTKKYAIEYLNTEEWKGYDYLFLLDKNGNHANIKPTAISGSDVPEAGINEVLIYNKSLYSYITKENDTYTMRIKYTGTDPDKNDYSSDYLMIFSWKDPEAVEPEVPEGDKVVINTFNSTLTTKVAEPSESALTYADGEYTVSALYGDANVDFKFKVGAYNATFDKYAVEFVNYEDYAGSYGYLLDKNGNHADIKPIATGTSEMLEGGIKAMLMYTKSTSSYIKKDNDTYTMYLKYCGTPAVGYGYTNDYYMVFSWVDPNAGVDGIEIDNENAPVEYYNLQGVKVENPAAGIYIRRQGKSVEKVVIK